MNPDDTAQNVSNGETPEKPPKLAVGGVLVSLQVIKLDCWSLF